MTENLPAQLLDLGTREFGEVWALQKDLVARRQREEIPDTLVFVEHPHVITLGRGTHKENLLATGDTPLFEIERGGDVTYHGPGQLVGYPIFLLREESERDLHLYLRNLEEALIRTVGRFGIAGERKQGWTGVWTAGGARKLASIGVAVKRWVTLHGFALNVATDLGRFAAINPCGLEATTMGSMSSVLGRDVSLADVKAVAREEMSVVFGRDFPLAEV
ncbi:MAG TPA: lipoyl(octanoyl) transferase LipB [Polyangia bacterium]|nr:lipoyl(octanoyl) transferase LipB [Polyangia bacterium]